MAVAQVENDNKVRASARSSARNIVSKYKAKPIPNSASPAKRAGPTRRVAGRISDESSIMGAFRSAHLEQE